MNVIQKMPDHLRRDYPLYEPDQTWMDYDYHGEELAEMPQDNTDRRLHEITQHMREMSKELHQLNLTLTEAVRRMQSMRENAKGAASEAFLQKLEDRRAAAIDDMRH